MKFNSLILVFVLINLNSKNLFAQNSIQKSSRTFDADTIIWNGDAQLMFSDFKGKPYGTADGLTDGGIGLQYIEESDGIHVFTYTFFLCNTSFLKDTIPYLRQHEQIHFNIFELYARMMRQMIIQIDLSKQKDAWSQVRKIYNQFYSESVKAQSRYDKESDHGNISEKQHEWQVNIQKQLMELTRFQGNEIIIR